MNGVRTKAERELCLHKMQQQLNYIFSEKDPGNGSRIKSRRWWKKEGFILFVKSKKVNTQTLFNYPDGAHPVGERRRRFIQINVFLVTFHLFIVLVYTYIQTKMSFLYFNLKNVIRSCDYCQLSLIIAFISIRNTVFSDLFSYSFIQASKQRPSEL